MPLPAEVEFRPPREHFELDLEAGLARARPDATVKGLFYNRTLALLDASEDVDALLEAAGIAARRFVPFRDYSWADLMRLSLQVGRRLVGDDSPAQALRAVGRGYYEIFATSLAGKLTFGMLGNSADRVLPLGPKAWNMSMRLGEVHGESAGPRQFRYHFQGFPAQVCETLNVGVVEGALSYCETSGDIRIAIYNELSATIDVTW